MHKYGTATGSDPFLQWGGGSTTTRPATFYVLVNNEWHPTHGPDFEQIGHDPTRIAVVQLGGTVEATTRAGYYQ